MTTRQPQSTALKRREFLGRCAVGLSLAATHWNTSFAAVTIGDRLTIEGFGGQRSY